MKSKDIEAMTKVMECLEKNIPVEQELFDAFALAVANCNIKLAQQKQYYRKNAARLRKLKKEWVENNRDRYNEYQRKWSKKKRDEVNNGQANNSD